MRYLLGFMLLVLSVPAPLYAVQVDGLYTTTVAVNDQSQVARNAAIRVAIEKVVQKVSGRHSILQNSSLQAALSNVGSYVEQFQYKPVEDDELGYWLIVSFQKAALDRVMQQFDVPVWGNNRPDVLVWFAVEGETEKYLVSAESENISALLKQAASDTGLAITLPLLDLEDQRAVSFNDIWAGFSDQILKASERYSAKQVMFGHLLQEGDDGWRLNWTLINANDQHAGFESSDTLESVLPMAFTEVAENLANVYAPHGAIKKNTLVITVTGVQSLSKFVEVMRYLSSLDMVKKLGWNQMLDDSVTFELSLTGSVSVLKGIIALNNMLSPDVAPNSTVTNATDTQQYPAQAFKQRLYYRAN